MSKKPNNKGPDRYPVDAEEDLIGRYENMVDIQIRTLSDIDDKAARTLRILSIILGIFLTAMSLSIQHYRELGENILPTQILLLGIGIVLLFVSIGYACITYLSSVFKFGPTEELGEIMAKYQVEPQDYRNNILEAYSSIIKRNRDVVQNNSRRFRRTMLFLLSGLLFLFVGGSSVAFRLGTGINVLFMLFTVIGTLALTQYLEEEEYLTLEWQSADDE